MLLVDPIEHRRFVAAHLTKGQTCMVLSKKDLTEELDLYRRIFDSVKNGVMITDAKGYVMYMNMPYGKFLDLDHEKQAGRHCTDVVENTRMHIVGRTGKPEINHLQQIKGLNIVVQRIPVKKEGKVIAVFGLVMFSDLREITKLAGKIGLLESKVKLYEDELRNLRSTRYTFDSIIGASDAILRLKEDALGATANNYPVLISGGTGTGKELFAQAIHHSSARNLHAFVRINCAAIPEDLLESELFGYDKGAFTGARAGGKPGKFELAHRGSMFLDEIGDMPLGMQSKILRVLEEKEFERVGGNRIIKSDFRLIAATNCNLEAMIRAGEFRSDLFYRLNVIPIQIPPLKERPCDIVLLCEHFLDSMASEAGHKQVSLDPKAAALLTDYDWPGNVRELVNILERTLARLDGDIIKENDLPFYIHKKKGQKRSVSVSSLKAVQQQAEKQALEQAMKRCDYNKSKASALLGIHRTLLYRKLKQYQIPLHPE